MKITIRRLVEIAASMILIMPITALALPKRVARPWVQNRSLTPGVTDPAATLDVICKTGYTAQARNVTDKMKRQVFALYGITDPTTFGRYEIDHLISLEVGGANDVRNLWPEPYCPLDGTGGVTCFGAREKDHAENYLHREVCAQRMTLSDAQRAEAKDWFQIYLRWRSSTGQMPATPKLEVPHG